MLNCIKLRGVLAGTKAAGAAALMAATLLPAGSTQAAQVAHDDFDYGPGVSFSTGTSNGGTGWTSAWTSTGVSSFVTSGSGKSMDFNQLPGLVVDGSTHIWSESSKGNYRNFPDVDMGSETLYMTMLVRDYGGGASVADLAVRLHDGPGAGGNMRGNFGIDGGTLFADGNTTGYGAGDTLAAAFATDTTYLLAMKRDSAGISAALIYADGLASTLAAEPVWQVNDPVGTGVAFESIRVLTNSAAANTGAGIRIDEVRLATDWAGAVAGLPIPEPSSLALASLGALAMIKRRR
jgi:hypothetical protein